MNKFVVFSILLTLLFTSCSDKSKESERKIVGKSMEQNTIPDSIAYPLYVGTYTRKEGHVDGKASGIHVGLLYPERGTVEIQGTYKAGTNPSYLTISKNNKYIYAVNEIGGKEDEDYGRITALTINDDLSLSILNDRSVNGVAPCHVSMDKQGTSVMVANYVTGDVTSFTTGLNGKLSGVQNIIKFRGKGKTSRQEASHAHYIKQLKSGAVIVTDLGTDSIHLLNYNGAQLDKKLAGIQLESGAGPRHIAVHPNDRFLYVVNELNATIDFISIEGTSLDKRSSVSTLPEGNSKKDGNCAAIKITSNGDFLYASNRGSHNNIAIYQINELGNLNLVAHQSTLGETPREISISPDDKYLIAANQDSDNLVVFRINQATGLLEHTSTIEEVATPVCIQFSPAIQL